MRKLIMNLCFIILRINRVLILILFSINSLYSNNIQISNVQLTGQNTLEDYNYVQFDISWENSWRTSINSANWDAAWVFVKYSVDDGLTWQHAKLNNTGNHAPNGANVQVGLIDEQSGFDNSINPAVGAFLYRSVNGTGTLSLSGVKLRWNYGEDGLVDEDFVDVRVFAIEMVYIPQGNFYLGSGGLNTSEFYKYPTTSIPFLVSDENPIVVGTNPDNLYYSSSTNGGDQTGTIPQDFPKGFNGFYLMKYEICQQQYVDFLNTISTSQATSRFTNHQSYRNGISVSGAVYSTSYPSIACNWLSWNDLSAYMDWSGLRPFTELEFEKACRGHVFPVVNEYAWGTSSINSSQYSISNDGAIDEAISLNFNNNGTTGNAVYLTTFNTSPLRCGIFAANDSNINRVSAGASYYGVMELSGNLWERIITIGNAAGRSFTPLHGDGMLIGATHDVISWPVGSTALGAGFRGGNFALGSFSLRVGARGSASYTNSTRYYDYGGRGARSSPSTVAE